MKFYIYSFVLVVLLACKPEPKASVNLATENKAENLEDYSLTVYNFEELQSFLTAKDNKTYVVNFWATWCAPCIKELPYFEKINAEYKNKEVEVLLVSLDFPKQYEKKLVPFIKEHKLQAKVVALNDPDSNSWIPKVAKDWSGAIPATLIFNKTKTSFYEQSFNYEELEKIIQTFIN